MDKINYDDKTYDIVEDIIFSGTKHLIITDNSNTLFVNQRNNKFYPAMSDLSIVNNLDIPLSYIRKQHLLWYLIEYINQRGIKDIVSIKKLITSFKKFIKNTNISIFLYWPLLNEVEFKNELVLILRDLEYCLGSTLQDNETKYMDIKIEKIA